MFRLIRVDNFLFVLLFDVIRPDASRQYVLVYPYQYVATRQDEASGTGFFETIQNFFVNFGQQQQQQNDENQSLDAVELDKPGVAPTAAPAAEGEKPAAAAAAPTKSDSKQKIVYSYLTPASTVPLNADRRLFFLAEQPQLFGSFSGPSVNPVFNLQPVPILASRSNVAQSQPDEPQPGKIVSENVQKFSQTPPVMASDEKTAEVKTTEIKPVEFKSVELPTIELKSIETPTHEVKTNELLVPELKSIELPAPEIKTVELPTPELKTVELPTPEVTIHELPAPELKPVELTPIEPVLKSTVIQEQTDSLQVDLAANRVAPIVADNRAIDVPEEIVKVPEVKVDEVSPVILARSSAVPLTITAAVHNN